MAIWNITILIIITFMVIIFVIIAVIWVNVLKKRTILPLPSNFTESSLGMRCITDDETPSILTNIPTDFTPQKCKSGLICSKYDENSQYGICLKGIGAKCSVLSECVLEAKYCKDICTNDPEGGVGQSCSIFNDNCFRAGNLCFIPEDLTSGICKAGEGKECSDNDHCFSNYCNNLGLCEERSLNGTECKVDDECLSNYCMADGTKSYCQQSRDLVVGENGYTCIINANSDGPKCSGVDNIDCAYSDVSDIYGVCHTASTVWPNNGCSFNNACIPPTICFDGLCIFPDDPNFCGDNTSGICVNGYDCINSICKPNSSGLPSNEIGVYGLVEWDRESVRIGRWNNLSQILSYTWSQGLELYSLDFNGGSLYMIGGIVNLPLTVNQPTSTIKTYRNLNGTITPVDFNLTYSFIDVNLNPIDPRNYVRSFFGGSNINLILTNLDLKILSFRLTMTGEMVFVISYFFFNSTHTRPIIINVEDTFFEDNTSFNITIIHQCYNFINDSGTFKDAFNRPKDKIFLFGPIQKDLFNDYWADTRVISQNPSSLLTLHDLNGSYYYISDNILNINNVNVSTSIYAPTRFVSPNILPLPYFHSKSAEFITNKKDETLFYIRNLLEYSNAFIEAYIYGIGKTVLSNNAKIVLSNSTYYNYGSLIQQIDVAFLGRKTFDSDIEMHHYTSGYDNTLPGYFSEDTIVCVSYKYTGSNNLYVIDKWVPKVLAITNVTL